ncbi:MAG: carboxypeptidase-like regulatory domain-containing protein [Prolixibacteraceae bacterium]|nr:carboxypeptidase-like regulatory domain-containing protein [Prolixibacteraceae bacterium]
MNKLIFTIFIAILLVFNLKSVAQTSNATIYGTVADENGNPLEMVNVALMGYPFGTSTNRKGEYLLRIPSQRNVTIAYSIIGYEMLKKELNLQSEELYELNIQLIPKSENIDEIRVTGQNQTSGNIVRIDPKAINNLPDVGIGNVEGLIKTLPGVNSSNELSNQYSVRGGSFDENLVYVNDIEVYRPYLVRAGQQEGLSFVNSDMVSSIEFSAGGFDAKYGDKMSSVLDITYNRPTEFAASVSASLLGGKAHIENISKNKKFTYNMGLRYKTFRYLLGSLDEKGYYNPAFFDYQGYFTYDLSPKAELGFLGTISLNRYEFIPQSRETISGAWNEQRRLYVDFDGQEVDRYKTYTGALFFNYKPTRNSFLKFIASSYKTHEEETFDIIGSYLLSEVQGEGTNDIDDSSMVIGIGMYHEHGRNYLDAFVNSFTHKGGISTNNNFLQWGFTIKNEMVSDQMKEWIYRDSSGYSLPYSDENVELYYSANNDLELDEQRYSGYIQDTYTFPTNIGKIKLTGGVRAHYWTYTDHLTVSPRFSASINTGIERDIIGRLSFGVYHQPPFFREIKNLYGKVNPDVQTPRSFHTVAGFDYSFIAWGRPFRLTAEAYYKALKNLIPYQIENVRIRYLSDQISHGYTYGTDIKVNGEFVSGTQSWVSLSLLKSEENIEGDGHGYIPRPTDQRFKFSMFFQDYLPGMPEYQMHMTGHIITGAPFGMPRTERYKQTHRMPGYKRVDIGFMRSFVTNGNNLTREAFFDRFESFNVSLDIFNLMNIRNVSSYFFAADYENKYYAIPNYLTGITFNLKVSAEF